MGVLRILGFWSLGENEDRGVREQETYRLVDENRWVGGGFGGCEVVGGRFAI